MEAYVKPKDIEAARDAMRVMAVAMNENLRAFNDLYAAIKPIDALSVEDRWVHTHGEMLSKRAAGKALGISVPYLNKLIEAGNIDTSPDGRVLVRSAAAWANSGKPKPKKKTAGGGCTFRIKP